VAGQFVSRVFVVLLRKRFPQKPNLQAAAVLSVKLEWEMDIILKLKFLSSLLLVCCLFLPLSQCSSSTTPKSGTSQQEVITKQYAFNSASEVNSWLNLLALLSPFVALVLTIKSKHKIKASLVVLLISLGTLYSVFCATLWSERILFGGYLAYFSCISLIILILFETWFNFRAFRQAKKV
jgi:membrane-associated HD superfamily phosphohydrolase